MNFLHVFLGALWVGGALFAGLVAGPVLGMAGAGAGPEAAAAFAARAAQFFRISGTAAIVLGLALAWMEGRFGPLAWASLVLAIALMGWGEGVVAKRGRAVMTAGPDERQAAVSAVMQASMINNIGFVILLALMVALRYQ